MPWRSGFVGGGWCVVEERCRRANVLVDKHTIYQRRERGKKLLLMRIGKGVKALMNSPFKIHSNLTSCLFVPIKNSNPRSPINEPNLVLINITIYSCIWISQDRCLRDPCNNNNINHQFIHPRNYLWSRRGARSARVSYNSDNVFPVVYLLM